MQIYESGLFVWSKISQKELKEIDVSSGEVGWAATLFAPVVAGTKFGIILNEENGLVRGGMRSRGNFDVSRIAAEFGGGGHRQSAGFTLNLSLPEAEKKDLEAAKKYIKN